MTFVEQTKFNIMNDQKVILVVTAKVNKSNMEDLKSYLEQAGPLTGKFGGQPIAKYKTLQKISGEQSPELISIAEFPNAGAINEMVNSDEFKALEELRATVFTKLNLMICE